MTAAQPPHYRAIRVVLAACVLIALLAAIWWLVQPGALSALSGIFGLRVR